MGIDDYYGFEGVEDGALGGAQIVFVETQKDGLEARWVEFSCKEDGGFARLDEVLRMDVSEVALEDGDGGLLVFRKAVPVFEEWRSFPRAATQQVDDSGTAIKACLVFQCLPYLQGSAEPVDKAPCVSEEAPEPFEPAEGRGDFDAEAHAHLRKGFTGCDLVVLRGNDECGPLPACCCVLRKRGCRPEAGGSVGMVLCDIAHIRIVACASLLSGDAGTLMPASECEMGGMYRK